MRSLLIAILVLSLALAANSVAITRVSRERDTLRKEEGVGLLFPSSISRIVALDYKGLLADVLFSRAQAFYGGKLSRKEKLSQEEWDWIYKSADIATDLDPYFLDPYYFGAMNLAWDAQRVNEANALLAKALHYRTWDWTIPFYLGFNYFYFDQNNEKAAYYLMEAAKRPGGSGGLAPTLAARLALAGGRTESAIAFLEDVIKKTDHELTRNLYIERLHALKGVLYLERAVEHYRRKYGRLPKYVEELVRQGIVREIPKDPYGGTFYITSDGAVKTTSNFTWKGKRKAVTP